MKLLLCVNRLADFSRLINHIEHSSGLGQKIIANEQSANFMYPLPYLQHEIDLCETGFGLFQTTYKTTKALTQKKYHLALKVSFCNAYKPSYQIGDIVNVIKEKPGDIGIPTVNGFIDLYDSKLLNDESFPHYKGGYVNMNNSYMNVLLPYKKVVGVTVNQYADGSSYELKRDKYQADIETGDGLGFVFACMYERQSFYQLNSVERNMTTGEHDFELAKQKLNEHLLDILQKI